MTVSRREINYAPPPPRPSTTTTSPPPSSPCVFAIKVSKRQNQLRHCLQQATRQRSTAGCPAALRLRGSSIRARTAARRPSLWRVPPPEPNGRLLGAVSLQRSTSPPSSPPPPLPRLNRRLSLPLRGCGHDLFLITALFFFFTV